MGSGARRRAVASQRDILTVPQRRPVKPVYIRRLVRFVEQVKEVRDAKA